VAIDIDGTLGDYHSHFLNFAEGYFGCSFPPPSEVNPGLRLWDFMGIPVSEYRKCKLAYRTGGMKRTMPAYDHANTLTSTLRGWGAEVWICTTRPYQKHDAIDGDTLEWLRRNGIQYDAILFDLIDRKYSKYEELGRQAGNRVAAIIDDLPELIESAFELLPSADVMVRDQPYNRHVGTVSRQRRDLCAIPPLPVRVYDCNMMLICSADAIQMWIANQRMI